MSPRNNSSEDVRSGLVEALVLDLIGPSKNHALENEVLPQSPSRWYLTGFLVPLEAKEEEKVDDTSGQEVLDSLGSTGTDDETAPDPPSAKRALFSSSMGLSLLVPDQARLLEVTALWGDYTRSPRPDTQQGSDTESSGDPDAERGTEESAGIQEPKGGYRRGKEAVTWRREQREGSVTIPVGECIEHPNEFDVPGSGGMKVVVTVRPASSAAIPVECVPRGTKAVSVFLVNRRPPAEAELKDESFAFQAELQVKGDAPFLARPNLQGLYSDEWDERLADLHYRHAAEYAVGHGVSTRAAMDGGECREVRTRWIPSAEVERVESAPIAGIELGMEALAAMPDSDSMCKSLTPMVSEYEAWLKAQRGKLTGLSKERLEAANELLGRAQFAASRIQAGIDLLADPAVSEAFCVANRAMAMAGRRRTAIFLGKDPKDVDPPAWRPFQLAFLLMNLRGIVDPLHVERDIVDLLFFPTGGGKTEAYLGLSAFTLVYRRLTNPGIDSAGVSILMRYTLRLLTLDQLGRAAALICALELERKRDPQKLGEWPFEIGLWVGMAATPNRMGRKGDNDPNTARTKTLKFQVDSSLPAPIPLENCPWCGQKFAPNSFELKPSADAPEDLRVVCVNRTCDFRGANPLPILAVDEPIYRRLPSFLIATVDKFASLPWTGQVGTLFGKVQRYDSKGFYGSCDGGKGNRLPAPLLPPDLIIQDELHLISGPMGSMVGLYEAAIDRLCSREVKGKVIRPKIIASTATVRRAESQVRALFDRPTVEVFPPPGPNLRDSFFARTLSATESPARLYVGIAAQGRSLKVIMLRSYLALLGAAQKAYEAEGGKRNKTNPADPYMTLVGYFNSLRELGGARRIVEDEVRTRLANYKDHKRVGEATGLFANRDITYEPVELTSRIGTNKVAQAKRKLAEPFYESDRVDVAIATNMISVGLDIVRLGLMVVSGQPKTSAEYIQATSRVGRDPNRPGLIVTLLNIHKPRDRSHYERFTSYHASFYRAVEATSVTPYSPRALDRGLAGAFVGLVRHADPLLTPALGATTIERERAQASTLGIELALRAQRHADPKLLPPSEGAALASSVKARSEDLLDAWCSLAKEMNDVGHQLQYQKQEAGGAAALMHDFLSPDLVSLDARYHKFKATRSMRDVEPDVNLWVKTLDRGETPLPEEEP